MKVGLHKTPKSKIYKKNQDWASIDLNRMHKHANNWLDTGCISNAFALFFHLLVLLGQKILENT